MKLINNLRTSFLFLFLFALSLSYAQEEYKIPKGYKEKIKLGKPFASLKKATGKTLCSMDTTLVKADREIVGLDNFEKYEFGIATYNEKEYLYLKKIWYWSEYKDILTSFLSGGESGHQESVVILDLEDYKEQVRAMIETDNVLFLDVLELNTNLTKNYLEPYEMSESDHYKKRREDVLEKTRLYYMIGRNNALIEENSPLAEYYSKEISLLDKPYREANKFVMKFRFDLENDTARFLFFTANKDFTVYPSFFNIYSIEEQQNFEITPEINQLMWTDELLDNIYYETNCNDFLKFIKAPLYK